MRHPSACVPAFVMILLCSSAASPTAQPYTARQNGDVVELQDTKNQTTVSIVPSVGNIAFKMSVKGHDILRWPFASVAEFKAKPAMQGIPFMGPWANRLDEQAFYANGRRYAFDMDLGNVRGAIPIHGFLTTNDQWKVVEVKADGSSARATSRLDFYRNPMWMKQFPFAHTIQMTYTLQDGVLQVATRIENLSTDPMPVSIGYHPYFQLTDSTREQWTSFSCRQDQLAAGVQQSADRRDAADRIGPARSAGRGIEGLRHRSRVQRSRAGWIGAVSHEREGEVAADRRGGWTELPRHGGLRAQTRSARRLEPKRVSGSP